ncbi:hypothetical protein STSP2_00311 [Anaerohalosphaera lusitana]|uniref:Uncharacterized protein n=1 Tax=Anaerohalosphaera lusitana TaxID=1936003 RepID=A0A1U9NHD1_9BACT|nr:hypothetical protein STSP2_00311 [Anaerohalosphaera lusitana]
MDAVVKEIIIHARGGFASGFMGVFFLSPRDNTGAAGRGACKESLRDGFIMLGPVSGYGMTILCHHSLVDSKVAWYELVGWVDLADYNRFCGVVVASWADVEGHCGEEGEWA